MDTINELRHIQRSCGDPNVRVIMEMLKPAKGGTLPVEKCHGLRKVERGCSVCVRYTHKPHHFQLTIVSRNLRFNHRVQVDTMILHEKSVAQMPQEATPFAPARFLKTQSLAKVLTSIQQMWSRTYMGPPDHVSVVQRTSYIVEPHGSCYVQMYLLSLRSYPKPSKFVVSY